LQVIGEIEGLERLVLRDVKEEKGEGLAGLGDLDLSPLCKLRGLQELRLIEVRHGCGLQH